MRSQEHNDDESPVAAGADRTRRAGGLASDANSAGRAVSTSFRTAVVGSAALKFAAALTQWELRCLCTDTRARPFVALPRSSTNDVVSRRIRARAEGVDMSAIAH